MNQDLTRIADKIARLCQFELSVFMIVATQDQLDLGLEVRSAAHEAYLVLSLLPEPATFREGVRRLMERADG